RRAPRPDRAWDAGRGAVRLDRPGPERPGRRADPVRRPPRLRRGAHRGAGAGPLHLPPAGRLAAPAPDRRPERAPAAALTGYLCLAPRGVAPRGSAGAVSSATS